MNIYRRLSSNARLITYIICYKKPAQEQLILLDKAGFTCFRQDYPVSYADDFRKERIESEGYFVTDYREIILGNFSFRCFYEGVQYYSNFLVSKIRDNGLSVLYLRGDFYDVVPYTEKFGFEFRESFPDKIPLIPSDPLSTYPRIPDAMINTPPKEKFFIDPKIKCLVFYPKIVD